MLIMKSADWLLVARPILLVCISLADIGVTLYQKVGYHLSFTSPSISSLFSSTPFLSPYLLSLYLLSSSFPFFLSPFPFTPPQIQLGGLGSAVNDACAGWSRHNAAASHIVTSRQSVI